MRLAMTLLIRDGLDVIDSVLRFHAALGVDLFVVGDHESRDGSAEYLEELADRGLIHFERLEGPPDYIWREGRTKLARRCHELGADWVINNDQDEFWWPIEGTLKDVLERIPNEYGQVVAPRTEYVARAGDESFAERMIYRESRFFRPLKSVHRAYERILLNHPHPTQIGIERDELIHEPFAGRPGIATGAESRDLSAAELELVIAPTYPIRILHFPLRSFDQYRRRMELALELGQLEPEVEPTIREAYENETLSELYAKEAVNDAELQDAIADGSLVEDTNFRDFIAKCPELGSDGPPPAVPSWASERSEVEFDAMYGLSRYVRRNKATIRKGGRYNRMVRHNKKLDAKVKRLKKRERAIQSSLWWRLRPRVPRRTRR